MSEDDIRAERHEEGREPVPGDTDAQADTASGVTRRTLLVVGILVVVLAFLAGFIGARMGFDEKRINADRHRGARERRNKTPVAA